MSFTSRWPTSSQGVGFFIKDFLCKPTLFKIFLLYLSITNREYYD